MRSPFQSVTKVAIEEMVRGHGSESKYGLFLTEEDIEALVADFQKLLETSRSLKAAGDRYLKQPTERPPLDIRRTVR